MLPEQVSDLNTIGLLFIVSMALLVLALPRRLTFVPIAITTCYMTFGQQLIVAGVHLTALRILTFVGLLRAILRRECTFQWLHLDTVLVAWALWMISMYFLLLQTPQALLNRLGVACDTVGLYLLFRCWLRDSEDLKRVCKIFAAAMFPLALCICAEKLTGRNAFYALGGVPEFTVIRRGILRCQGPFAHPILAGTFGAVWLPLFIGLWWQGKGNRFVAVVGIISSTLITALSGSSGPLVSYMAGILALSLRPMQKHMRAIRWGIVASIVGLQMIMHNPVWFIFAHINILDGSTGWHRSHLIDETIKHISEWWLIGTKLESVGAWGVWASDVTNQYILEGVTGGLLTLILFIAIIVSAFSGIGRALKKAQLQSRRSALLFWALGAALFAHVVTYFSVSYFDQNLVNWYLLLAMVATAITMRNRVTESVSRATGRGRSTSYDHFHDGKGLAESLLAGR
jgi:hypothetical protein